MSTVFLDIDTQIDFMYPAGALYVPGAERILPLIARLNRHAVAGGGALISTVDAHAENDPEFLNWPAHCVVGTIGQGKPAVTLIETRKVITSKANGGIPPATGTQILLEKQKFDCFTNPNLVPLLDQLSADRYVVYGVVTEICVRFAVQGLIKRGARVELVSDAVQSLDPAAADLLFEEIKASGGSLVTTANVCS